ncbi:MAG TPA: UDP-N-acetylmuramate:L-alanyl-gamma-D-glutamyl-meso-diaminopimelate ligase [Candidatus Saccharimonadales bacterium]|jgi:UDP-N-acetylmuramate: L-alanyl-gamma-D-glutamyl-meso-diaminopimelate ligase|nr:UDP-N-acetylmuramate:L-alanyl-gamma-D-glutamyl-meso-diaminopimelate ligase [Candidatus Saccharimonadales bacterium]
MTKPMHFHLSGIGGAAMTPLAGMLAASGHRVTGSDAGVYPPASTLLESLGIGWKNGFDAANLEPVPDIVVIGNALSRGNPEVEAVLDNKIPYRSLPQTLEEFFLAGHDSLVVTGTHGKTTTTSMLSWILHHAGRHPNFLIGGVAENFGRSFGLGGGKEFVLEGDEYDSAFFDKAPKFLHYHPQEVILTSLEFDHADIYENLAAIELQFRRLVNLVPKSGRIVAWGESESVRGVLQKAYCPMETYGFAPGVDWLAGDLEIRDGQTHFRISRGGKEVARIKMAMAGRHNVLNATAAAAIAHGRGVSGEAIASAMAEFRGVLRRLEVKGETSGVLVVDDFAHHPTAIRATIDAARHRWPGRKLWAVFEPRSNTMRRKVFEKNLADSLATADAAVLGAVNRANLLSDNERMSPTRVLESITEAGKSAAGFETADEIAKYLSAETSPGDLVLVMSNGSFDGLCGKLLGKLQERSAPAGKIRA